MRTDRNEDLNPVSLALANAPLEDEEISEDEERRALDDVQKTTDAHIAKMDLAAKAKEKDILDIK